MASRGVGAKFLLPIYSDNCAIFRWLAITIQASKAADGNDVFSEPGKEGWFPCIPHVHPVVPCVYTPLPGPQPPKAGPDVVKQWLWDGVNGNNAVWTGSSAGGIRLFPKGTRLKLF